MIAAAKDANKLAIGVDSDQDDAAKGNVLTSMVKHVDEAVFSTIQDVKDGKFGREETPGFQRMIAGIVQRNARDEARIERGTELLNDLYESLRPSPPEQSAQS